jgi:hypothetical protein
MFCVGFYFRREDVRRTDYGRNRLNAGVGLKDLGGAAEALDPPEIARGRGDVAPLVWAVKLGSVPSLVVARYPVDEAEPLVRRAVAPVPLMGIL